MAVTTTLLSGAGIGATAMTTRPEPSIVTDLETTELRLFAAEPLPSEVERWVEGWAAAVERRRDVYFIDGRADVGVKRRAGTTLELKVRCAIDAPMDFGDGLMDHPEVWRKWSPADGLVELPDPDERWVDVDKEIFRRRFDIDGVEHTYAVDSIPAWPGCDVEVVRVGVGAVSGWTLALTAFGPSASRLRAIVAAWSAVGAPDPVQRSIRACHPMGYPEWLATHVDTRQWSARRRDRET